MYVIQMAGGNMKIRPLLDKEVEYTAYNHFSGERSRILILKERSRILILEGKYEMYLPDMSNKGSFRLKWFSKASYEIFLNHIFDEHFQTTLYIQSDGSFDFYEEDIHENTVGVWVR